MGPHQVVRAAVVVVVRASRQVTGVEFGVRSWSKYKGARSLHNDVTLFAVFVIFTGAAVLGGIALYARQSLLVAYIVLGGLLGPWGFRVVTDTSTIQGIGHIGIIFLLFLLGKEILMHLV